MYHSCASGFLGHVVFLASLQTYFVRIRRSTVEQILFSNCKTINSLGLYTHVKSGFWVTHLGLLVDVTNFVHKHPMTDDYLYLHQHLQWLWFSVFSLVARPTSLFITLGFSQLTTHDLRKLFCKTHNCSALPTIFQRPIHNLPIWGFQQWRW